MSADNLLSPHAMKPGRVLSLNEQAYLRFKQALVTLSYRPGEYLNTAQVMADLELGRTPVNQAIHRLAAEGLLQIIPRKGVMVAALSLDDALALIEVRLVNEILCIRLACQQVNTKDIADLTALNQQIAQASARREPVQMMLLDQQFHQQLASIAANNRLGDILSVIHAQAQRFWATTLSQDSHMHEVVTEHQMIIDALSTRDIPVAEHATRLHILSFKRALLGR